MLHGIKTPETPYGGAAASPKTRKYWKLQLDELKRFDMTEEQKREFEVRNPNDHYRIILHVNNLTYIANLAEM